MRNLLACSLLLIGGVVSPAALQADEEIIVEEVHRGIPVQNAILTRRYGAVETEDEVAQQEFEAGYGASNLFQFVHWRRAYRPFGWYGAYGGFGYGYGFYGPRYYVGYRPRYMSYYPAYGYGYGVPYWGGYGGYYGGYGGYGGYYGAMPYSTFYAPSVYYGGYGGFGGCYYW